MSIGLISILMVSSLLLLLVIGVHLAFALGIVAVAFATAFFGWDSLLLISARIYGMSTVYILVAVPLFLLMASIMDKSGVARDLYDAMSIWAGGLHGGVAVMTLFAAVFMAATTGIIGGEIILLGLVALPQMLRLGYDQRLAIGTICAGGSLGTMIPPSIVLIFFGLTASVSIGELFVAVIFPGLLLATFYVVYVLVRCRLNPDLGPPLPAEQRDIPIRAKLVMLKGLVLPLFIAFSVLGSIYLGIAAVAEAAAVGVLGTIFAAWVRGKLSWQLLRESVQQAMTTCGLLLWLTFGATALIGVYNLLGGIRFVHDFMVALPFEPLVIILIMMSVLLVLGLFMDWIGILLLTMPIFAPIIESLGYDLIWFGILFCMNMQVSFLSPPFGPAAFYLKGVAPPTISLQEIYRSLWPFMLMQIAAIFLVIVFPDIALWLPRVLMRGG